MTRKRRRQKPLRTLKAKVFNKAPTWVDPTATRGFSKKRGTGGDYNELFEKALEDSFERHTKSQIRKTEHKKLAKLKKDMLKVKRIPQYIVSNAEDRNDKINRGELTDYVNARKNRINKERKQLKEQREKKEKEEREQARKRGDEPSEETDDKPSKETTPEEEKKISAVHFYHEFVRKNFDDLAKKVKAKYPDVPSKPSKATKSSKRDKPGESDESESDGDEPEAKRPKTATEDEEEMRTFIAPMNAILRLTDEMPRNFHYHFLNTLHNMMKYNTDFISTFGMLVNKYILFLKDHTFHIEGLTVQVVERNGPPIQDFFPAGFLSDSGSTVTHVAPHYEQEGIERLDQHFRHVFNSGHFGLMQSHYFGARGARDKVLQEKPLVAAFINNVPHERERYQEIPGALMTDSVSQYAVNFEVMWGQKRRHINLLNNLLSVLLKVHLAPIREQRHKDFVKTKIELRQKTHQKKAPNVSERIPVEEITLINKTYNERRRLFKDEQRRKLKYTQKADLDPQRKRVWLKRARRCQQRLNTYNAVLERERAAKADDAAAGIESMDIDREIEFGIDDLEEEAISNPLAEVELLEEEDEEIPDEATTTEATTIEATTIEATNTEATTTEATTTKAPAIKDATRRRIKSLVAVCRNLLFQNQGEVVTGAHIQDTCPDITDKELQVIETIVNLIMPYVPEKKYWSTMGHQIPLVLMANDVLRYAGKGRFARALAPLPRPSSLNALVLNSHLLHAIFCSHPARKLAIYRYDGTAITNPKQAIDEKEAVFNSFFDMNMVNTIASNYKLDFTFRMIVLPGLKTVHLQGTPRRKGDPTFTCKPLKESTQGVSKEKAQGTQRLEAPKPPAQSEQDKERVKQQKLELNKEIREITDQLKVAVRERNDELLNNDMATMKKLFIRDPQSLHQSTLQHLQHGQINAMKKRRKELNAAIQHLREEIRTRRAAFYQLVAQKTTPTTPPVSEVLHIDQDNYRCYAAAENVTVSDDILDDTWNFAGTDNGLVTTTETSRFNLSRYRAHLELYNYYQVLGGSDIDVFDEVLEVPKTFKVTARDIQFKTGRRRRLEKLERSKNTVQGHQIRKVEDALTVHRLANFDNIDHLNQSFNAHMESRHELRSFYYSNQRIKNTRTGQIQVRREYDRLCSEERKFVNHKDEDEDKDKEKTKNTRSIVFVGDRGTGVGSTVKGYLRYGGNWKPLIHSRYTSVCVTNEHGTSQTCCFCFSKIYHPVRVKGGTIKTVRGTSICSNDSCASLKKNQSHKPRDGLSALLIGLSGLSTTLCKSTFPQLAPKVSEINTEQFNKFATTFLKRNVLVPTSDGGNSRKRLDICSAVTGATRGIIEDCFKWANQRKVFGKRLIDQPVIRNKLASMVAQLESVENWLENIHYQRCNMSYREQSIKLAGPIALLKYQVTRVSHNVADDACQIFGGRAITKTGMGRTVEAFQRTYKFGAILGGSEEIMADLGIRQAMKYYPQGAKL